MEIHFLGAAQTVTGSQHLLEVNGHKLMLDCGLYQGHRQEAIQRNRTFHFNLQELDAVILSHAHLDHCGNLPNLVKFGYRGPIHAQRATAHLARYIMEDSAHIQEDDAKYLNKRLAREGKPLVQPLYTTPDAQEATKQLVEQDYDRPFQAAPGVQVTFVEAGHILGSTAIVLDIEESGRKFRFWFSGDIGRPELPLIKDPVLPSNSDYLLMECTYGDRLHPPQAQAYEQLRDMVKDTLERGGKVIVPAFAVGRTQDIVFNLHKMFDAGELPLVPVFVDSPLAVNVSDVYRAHPECLDAEARQFLATDPHGQALGFERLTYIHSVEESKALNERKEPMIIISTSGMLETGRVLHHLEQNINNPNSLVLIVSWMAPNTLGRRLVDGEMQVRIFGQMYERKIRVAHIDGFSAHADQRGLKEYALAVKDQVKRVFLVHGEAGPAQALTVQLRGAGIYEVHFPPWGSQAEL